MAGAHRLRPTEVLRNLALSLERMATHEAASSAVQGAAEGLRGELPELDGQLRALLEDGLTALARLAHEAATSEHAVPGQSARSLASEATRGVLEQLEREWQDGGLPFAAFADRLNRLLDGAIAFVASRRAEILEPGGPSRTTAAAMVEGAAEQLHQAFPALARDLAHAFASALAEELAQRPHLSGEGALRRASQEVCSGALAALEARLRRPLQLAACAGAALLGLRLLARRRHA